MLLELIINDFALIDNLKLEFCQGLNILTGETGAGKSIIIDSVNFVLGERSSKDIVRYGAEKTYVEAVFENPGNTELSNMAKEYGFDLDDGLIILSREMTILGRSICRINGRAATSSILKEVGNYLIDIHGQHEHQSLLNEDRHRELLDMFGGNNLKELKKDVYILYHKVSDIKKELRSLAGDGRERERKLDLLNFQINEINEAKLKIGEEDELLKQKKIVSNSEKLFLALSNSYNILYGGLEDSPPVSDRLGLVISEIESVLNIDDSLKDIYKGIEDSYYSIEAIISDIREYRDNIEFDPELINTIELRLDLINNLKRKYGSSIEDIIEFKKRAEKELEYITSSQDRINELEIELQKQTEMLYTKSLELSKLRKVTAEGLEKSIVYELKFLGMEKAIFKIDFNTSKINGQISYSENGFDVIRFLISMNPGEAVKPLSKVASGGETSRIMLAIKTAFADTDNIPSLIFDEIDTGISGKAAQAVAEKLGQISSSHQVICVTHLPQIASMADTHFYISKSVFEDRTKTSVEKLSEKDRISEIARMLGGAKITELTLKHSEEMINMAKAIKKR